MSRIAILGLIFLKLVAAGKPNIVFILADDLGWNDVGYQGSCLLSTPNIDALAFSGVILSNYYVMPMCTPSRSALMTGKHPIHTGMQHGVIYGKQPYGLSLKEKLLPEYLREHGYKNHIVGKWHLGHFKKEYTPLFRGFDSHFGNWAGHQDYYSRLVEEGSFLGYDMRRGLNVSWKGNGKYITTLLTEEAEKLIGDHDVNVPLFLYLPHVATHSGNTYQPLQAPNETVEKFQRVPHLARRTFAAMASHLDDSVGRVVEALSKKGILDNTIIIFSTDNGGPAGGMGGNAASNWPLRGSKRSLWQGGVRGAGFVWSPMIKNTPRVTRQLMHIQDWLPTLMGIVAGENFTHNQPHLDGRDVWAAINDPKTDTYKELLVAIDNKDGVSSLILKNDTKLWKIIKSRAVLDHNYVCGSDECSSYSYNISALFESSAACEIKKVGKSLPTPKIIQQLRKQAHFTCKKENKQKLCKPENGEICLFELVSDPCEEVNLFHKHRDIAEELIRRLEAHNKTIVPLRNKPYDSNADPICWDGIVTNWMDYETPLSC